MTLTRISPMAMALLAMALLAMALLAMALLAMAPATTASISLPAAQAAADTAVRTANVAAGGTTLYVRAWCTPHGQTGEFSFEVFESLTRFNWVGGCNAEGWAAFFEFLRECGKFSEKWIEGAITALGG